MEQTTLFEVSSDPRYRCVVCGEFRSKRRGSKCNECEANRCAGLRSLCTRRGAFYRALQGVIHRTMKSSRKAGRTFRKKGKELTIGALELMYTFQGEACALSGQRFSWKPGSSAVPSIDRIDCSGDYVVKNCRLVCARANQMRNDMSDGELLWWCRRVAANLERLEVIEVEPGR